MSSDLIPLLGVLGTALKDLLKFKVVSYVSTGDKTQDNLINAFLLSCLTILFTASIWKTLIQKCRRFGSRYRDFDGMDEETVDYLKSILPEIKHKLNYGAWHWKDEGARFSQQITTYYLSVHDSGSPNNFMTFNFQTNRFEYKPYINGLETLRRRIGAGIHEPIFADRTGVIYIYKGDDDEISMAYSSQLVLDTFLKLLEAIQIPETKESTKLKIYDSRDQRIGFIFPDRNFDLFVSKHKQTIIASLDAFKQANKSGSSLGGYGSYNLGMLIYGDPGTGKTSLIRAIAVYLKWHVKIIDMNTIRTKQDFRELFEESSNYVYCLDEFDCVQGAIAQRTEDDKLVSETSTTKELREMKERLLELLRISSSAPEMPGKTESPMAQELANVRKRITDLENVLTIDTVLEVLDGVNEKRGRVIIATTNFINKIDTAILRHGRFDLKIELRKFEDAEIKEMLMKMFGQNASPQEIALLNSTKFVDYQVSPAELVQKAGANKTLARTIEALPKEKKLPEKCE